MSARTAGATHRRRPAAGRRAQVRRRRIVAVLAAAALAAFGAVLLKPLFHQAVQEIALPLRHEDIIRQQAADKGLDPALIAAVIYAESRFVDGRTSSAGAEGLMQLTPATAQYIATKSGGTQFQISDLGTPQVNIAYGAFYLRYLMARYGGNQTLALAAYNAGEGNVDRWVADARGREESLRIDAIPFGETRGYVRKVLAAEHDYRAHYRDQLGL
ncbi:lytic transglycosylase domain-containing protein [Baekduia soli]|uniref:Lytic transglycosylase domain-containing protein n=1 Tax=Baekduia soli TaxID=496014 RepID=A0A5B8UAA4_9ACTN|nr:lytic transglycosylase domain-containing protein [Baekduia soli]QEC49602.1 lytic transglycosylase domain-containing protein [Baekduia soli]